MSTFGDYHHERRLIDAAEGLVKVEKEKADALEGLNERLDDMLAFGLMYLQAHWGAGYDPVEKWSEIRKVLKDRKSP